MRIRPIYVFFFPLIVVVAAGAGWIAHRPGTSPPPRLSSISVNSTVREVTKHFNLGTNRAGLEQYTDTSCIPAKGYDVCAWDYAPDSHKWAVTLFLREPQGSTAQGPPVGDR